MTDLRSSIEVADDGATQHRDDVWLIDRLVLIRSVHFRDVAGGYPIEIRFGTRARYRFGSISARNGVTLILINQLFADPRVPEYVIDSTIAHELAHYAHGYGSGLPKVHANPHRGGVVDQELAARGLAEVTEKSERWREANWDALYNGRCSDLVARRAKREEAAGLRWEMVLAAENARTEEELRDRLHTLAGRMAVAAGMALFEARWLEATVRQNGSSYWYSRSRTVKLHGLLADRRVPDCVVEFELAYWLARHRVGGAWQDIHRELVRHGLGSVTEQALRWRRAKWTAFRNRNHPLRG